MFFPLKYREFEEYLISARLLMDPVNRPGIKEDEKHFMYPDHKILGMKEPPPGKWKAYHWKQYCLNNPEAHPDDPAPESDADLMRLGIYESPTELEYNEDSSNGKPNQYELRKRKALFL